MGCINSVPSEKQGQPRGPRPRATIPSVNWMTDMSWAAANDAMRQRFTEEDSNSPAAIFKRASAWLAAEYADCARRGAIADLGGMAVPMPYGPCRYPGRWFMVLDDKGLRVAYAAMLVLAVPADMGHEPGALLNMPEMIEGKDMMLEVVATMGQDNMKVGHAEVIVIMGADMVRCRFNGNLTEPIIGMIVDKPPKEAKKMHKTMLRVARRSPDESTGFFLPFIFRTMVGALEKEHPGCTVWDEGEFGFSVDGKPYAHPARLLMVRNFRDENKDSEASLFKVLTPKSTSAETPVKILRSDDSPGGVVHIMLIVAIPQNILWPQIGDYMGKPVMKAAESALLEHARKLNREGKMQRCAVEVCMGVDKTVHGFVGAKLESDAQEPKTKKDFRSLEGFSIGLEELEKHQLFDSESHFQVIKQHMRERAMQYPERFQAMAPEVAALTARHFLEANYPGNEVTDEGELPVTIDGQSLSVSGTRIMVARAAGQEKNNVVAVIHSVPLPRSGADMWATAMETNWCETDEMKAAEKGLLGLLKQWYKDGKIAEDCMAQVMMGTDASTYKFVDGERFEDYDDERMKQIKWQ